jgi:hypothetical protein
VQVSQSCGLGFSSSRKSDPPEARETQCSTFPAPLCNWRIEVLGPRQPRMPDTYRTRRGFLEFQSDNPPSSENLRQRPRNAKQTPDHLGPPHCLGAAGTTRTPSCFLLFCVFSEPQPLKKKIYHLHEYGRHWTVTDYQTLQRERLRQALRPTQQYSTYYYSTLNTP